MELGEQQSSAVLGRDCQPIKLRDGFAPALLLGGDQDIGGERRRNHVCVRLSGSRRVAKRVDAAMVRWHVGTPRILGRQHNWVWSRWNAWTPLYGAAACCREMGPAA